MAKPLIALVGRANVGKSTLFNRIIGQRLSIIEDIPGTTRDRLYASGEWNGREFTLIDTGGIELGEEGDIVRRVREQAKLAISEADVVVFLVDSRGGVTSEDLEIADMLRASSKPVLLAANKADNEVRRLDSSDFYQLGLGEVMPISAFHGTGTGDLLDEMVSHLPPAETEEDVRGDRGRHRRTPERREVLAAQRDPGRRALDRQRPARHHSRRHRYPGRARRRAAGAPRHGWDSPPG